jgi:serine/threonine protein kinase
MVYATGELIGDGYEVREILGAGGFGVVYLAYSRVLNKLIALKTFRDEFLSVPAVRDLFRKEARLWINIGEHPFVVEAYWVDEIDGRLFVASEFVSGDESGLTSRSLDKVLRSGPLELPVALRWAVHLCFGMEYAYERGIRCHRDLKPSNILVDHNQGHPILKVSDFGLAGALLGLDRSARMELDTRDGTVGLTVETIQGFGVGTPTHMPPEQFTDPSSCDQRSDVYSFGITLFQMVEGRVPYLAGAPRDDSDAEAARFMSDMFRLHCDAPVPTVASPLSGVVERCLQKRPECRYQTFCDVWRDLLRVAEREFPGRGITAKSEEFHASLQSTQAHELGANGWHNRGTSLAALGNVQAAIRCYDRALELNPSLAGTWSSKGIALQQLGHLQEAVECYNEALALDPGESRHWHNKGRALIDSGAHDEALSCFDEAVRLDPGGTHGWLGKASVLATLGRRSEAADCVEKAISINPKDSEAWLKRGCLLSDSDRLDEAADAFRVVLEIDPRNGPAWCILGDVLSKLGQPGEALPCYQKAVELEPGRAEGWFGKWVVEQALGYSEAAEESFSKFLPLSGLAGPPAAD